MLVSLQTLVIMDRLFWWILSLIVFAKGYDWKSTLIHLDGWDDPQECDMACQNAYYVCGLLNHHIDIEAANEEDLSHFSPHFLDSKGRLNKNCWFSYLACAHDCLNYGSPPKEESPGKSFEEL